MRGWHGRVHCNLEPCAQVSVKTVNIYSATSMVKVSTRGWSQHQRVKEPQRGAAYWLRLRGMWWNVISISSSIPYIQYH